MNNIFTSIAARASLRRLSRRLASCGLTLSLSLCLPLLPATSSSSNVTLGLRPCPCEACRGLDDGPLYALLVSLPSRGVRGALPLLESPVELAGLLRRANGRVGGATGERFGLDPTELKRLPPLGDTTFCRPLLPPNETEVGMSRLTRVLRDKGTWESLCWDEAWDSLCWAGA